MSNAEVTLQTQIRAVPIYVGSTPNCRLQHFQGHFPLVDTLHARYCRYRHCPSRIYEAFVNPVSTEKIAAADPQSCDR